MEASTIKRLHSLSLEVTRLKGKLKVLQVFTSCCCSCCRLCVRHPLLLRHLPNLRAPSSAPTLLGANRDDLLPREDVSPKPKWEDVCVPKHSFATTATPPLPPLQHTRPCRTRPLARPPSPPPANKTQPGRKRHPCGDPPLPLLLPSRRGANYLQTPSRGRCCSAIGGCRRGGGGGEEGGRGRGGGHLVRSREPIRVRFCLFWLLL